MITIRVLQMNVTYYMVHNWIQFFVSMYNATIFENYFINELNDRGEYILT